MNPCRQSTRRRNVNWPLEFPSYSLHAGDVSDLLAHLAIAEATILGNAVGSRAAQAFAEDYPEKTSAVILAPAGGVVEADPEEARITGRMFRPDATDDDIAAGMALMVGSPATSQRVWAEISASQIKDPATLAAETGMTQPFDKWWAPEGTTPFLVVQDALNRQAPPENAHRLKADLGERATIEVIPGVGHLAVIEDRPADARAIVEFLNTKVHAP